MSNINTRANILADRLLPEMYSLPTLAKELSDLEWNTPVLGNGRTIGIVVHHVVSVYSIEVELAQIIINGNPYNKGTREAIDKIKIAYVNNRNQADKQKRLKLLKKNRKAYNIVPDTKNDEHDYSSSVSVFLDAPIMCQFLLEDHAPRPIFHHFNRIKIK